MTGIDLPRNRQSAIWHPGSPCVHGVWPHDEHFSDIYVVDWRFRRRLKPYRNAYSCSLLLATPRRYFVYYVWRDQGYLLDGLGGFQSLEMSSAY